MLGIEKLEELLEFIHEKIDNEITFANRESEEELNRVLEKYGFTLPQESYSYIDLFSSKILIVGQLNIKKKAVDGICKTLNIDSDRIDYISYDEATNYNFESLRYSNKYSDIIFGAVPHKGGSIGKYNSIISMLEKNQEEYPKVIRATIGNELKITKTSLKEALTKTRIFTNRHY